MEEADALSDRIGILVEGKLRCLGSPQRLKHVYGNGYNVRFLSKSEEATKLLALKKLPELLGNNLNLQVNIERLIGKRCQINVSMSESERGEDGLTLLETIFEVMNSLRPLGLMEFSVSQTSLQTVFIEFAKLQKL
jgi:ABC-type multidrug transport system ATPase subunit